MKNAYPADELMPLTCKGRTRGRTPSRGDVDDALGNFQLTLVDALDTLAFLGRIGKLLFWLKLVKHIELKSSNLRSRSHF